MTVIHTKIICGLKTMRWFCRAVFYTIFHQNLMIKFTINYMIFILQMLLILTHSNLSFFSLMVCDFYIFKYIVHHPKAMKIASTYLFRRISFFFFFESALWFMKVGKQFLDDKMKVYRTHRCNLTAKYPLETLWVE